ncbi:MAG TPA: hypothetical protein VN175_08655 [Rhizomicrobium sp.]|nr:hypothetical protein [Rhizomicrobium sp.]
MAILKLIPMLGLVVTLGAAAQENKPVNGAPRSLAQDQASQAVTSDAAKKREQGAERQVDRQVAPQVAPQVERQASRQDISRDPDRSPIGPRTTQGLAQDAISRSNSR